MGNGPRRPFCIGGWPACVGYAATADRESTPDIHGCYAQDGEHNLKPLYVKAEGDWYVWWDGAETWKISQQPDESGTTWWALTHADPWGEYPPHGLAVGTVNFAAV